MPLLLLLALFVIVPIAEIWAIIQVGQAIGVLWTIALLIGDSIIGSWLLRQQGRRAWQRFTGALSAGQIPAREVADGGLIMFGGALLLSPGFLTDLLGLALLLPPSRALVRRVLVRRFATVPVVAGGAVRRPSPRRGYDVDGTVSDEPGQGPELPA